jgi:hypothetical protein
MRPSSDFNLPLTEGSSPPIYLHGMTNNHLNRLVILNMMKRSWRTGLLLTASFAGLALTGCATDGRKFTADNPPPPGPADPAWFQSNDNPFHAD